MNMIPSLPTSLYPVFRGVTATADGSLCVTREYFHGVLEISALDREIPQDALLAADLALFCSN